MQATTEKRRVRSGTLRRLRVVLATVAVVFGLAAMPGNAVGAGLATPTATANEPLSLPQVLAAANGDRPVPGEPVDPEPDWPFYPDGNGFPYGVSDDPLIPRSAEDVKTGDPTCQAPALPPGHNTGDGGYQVPIRIKLSDGFVQAGFSPNAYKYGQYPFAEQMSLTGWVVGTASLPSMQINVEPDGVIMCDDGLAGLATPQTNWDEFEPGGTSFGDAAAWVKRARSAWQNGIKYQGIPGSFFAMGYHPKGIVQIQVKEFVASMVSATAVNVTDDGRLRLRTSLATNLSIDFVNTLAGTTIAHCLFKVDATLDSRAKQMVRPEKLLFDGKWVLGAPPPIPAGALAPTRPLSGAIEGGTATLGTNSFHIENRDLPQTPVCYVSLPIALFGFDENGRNQAENREDVNGYTASPNFQTLRKWPPISRGVADLSVDMTIDKVGMPRFEDIPSGYGFEGRND